LHPCVHLLRTRHHTGIGGRDRGSGGILVDCCCEALHYQLSGHDNRLNSGGISKGHQDDRVVLNIGLARLWGPQGGAFIGIDPSFQQRDGRLDILQLQLELGRIDFLGFGARQRFLERGNQDPKPRIAILLCMDNCLRIGNAVGKCRRVRSVPIP